MKVLLIKPTITFFKFEEEYSPYEPLGLMYLASHIRAYSDSEVRIMDASTRTDLKRWEGEFFKLGYTDDMIENEIVTFQPDLIGISAMFTINSKGVHDVAKLVKSINRDIIVVVGGAHASAFPHWIVKDENIDIAVKGEGEQTLLEIIHYTGEKKNYDDIKGIIYRKDGDVVETPDRDFIKNLDSIPNPARDLVNMDEYFYEKYNYSHAMAPPRATVVTSRGCPYKCKFCSIHSIWRHSYRMRDPVCVVDEIESLVKRYGVKEIAFFDDNISVSRKRMLEICNEILKRKINIKWCTPNGIAIWTLDKEILARMKESGCYKLTFGIETGSIATQKFIRKSHIDLKKAKELIKYCNKIGIWTHSSFILGFPYETEKDILNTIEYAVNCDVDMATFFIATPYPGTELYDICEKEKLLPDFGDKKAIEWFGSVGKTMCDTLYFSHKEIDDFIAFAQRKVFVKRAISFMNPLRVLPKIQGLDEIKYFGRQIKTYSRKLYTSLAF